MAKVTSSSRDSQSTVTVKTTSAASKSKFAAYKWWKSKTKKQLAEEVISTAMFLKEMQQYRYRQCGTYARLYGNAPLFNYVGTSLNKTSMSNKLPVDRPTMNVVQSVIDTKVARLTQDKPRPYFLTENGDYKQRNLAKTLNNFIMGEFYQTKAYPKGNLCLRDGFVMGDGVIKIVETSDHRVSLERKLLTEILVDPVEARLSSPRQMFEMGLIDRDVAIDLWPEYRSIIEKAEQAYPDASAESNRTISDQIMVVEAWHLPSGKNAGDGRHVIVCSEGALLDDDDFNGYNKERFPFVFLPDSTRIDGFWSQGTAERLMGTQVQINQMLQKATMAIDLACVPRVWMEASSKIPKAHVNNQLGMIGMYHGTPPIFQTANALPEEYYSHLQRLITYAYQQEGVSQLAASSQKPAGLNSGEAIRNYDDIQSDRLAVSSMNWKRFFEDLAYGVMDKAIDIAKEQGSYETVFPDKNGTEKIALPKVEELEDPFVIQCFDVSSLPREPAGRLQRVTEMAQAGMINMQEARRLIDYPDIDQVDKLDNAAEERVLKILDQIVYEGKYTPPDPFIDIALAQKLTRQYYNLHVPNKLSEDRAQLLRDFATQISTLQQAATPPAQPQVAQAQPIATPQARPQSDVLPLVQQ